jgi:hypothetical protein
MPKPFASGRPHATCLRTRLAETSVAAIDYCQCGHIHLHLGPFSMRLTPEALVGLGEVIGQALSTHEARDATERSLPALPTRTSAFRRGGDA